MDTVQKVDAPQVGILTNGGGIYSNSLNLLKSLGKVGASILAFSLVSATGFITGNKLVAILGLFYVLSIIIRIPDTYSDVFYFESIATFGLIISLAVNPFIAIFFTITAEWLTKLISPFGPIEDYQETLSESVAVTAAILLLAFLIPFHGNLLWYMIYFHAIRFAIFYAIVALTSPAVILHDLLQGIAIVPLSVIQSYIILLIVGTWAFGLLGFQGWTLISIHSLFIK